MAESGVITAWQLFVGVLGAIASTGLAVVLIESFRDWLFKRREEYTELTKQKIEVISKATPYYNQLAMNSWNFGWNIVEVSERDYARLMYYMCNML